MVEKVSFTYWYGGDWKTGVSKIYGKIYRYFPSGRKLCYKVWNNDRKHMEWVKDYNTKLMS